MEWNLLIEKLATITFDTVLWIIIIGTILVIVMDNRNPVKTLAWILVLIFLPVVGLVFYFFFGRSQRHERIIGKKVYGHLMKKPIAEYMAQPAARLPEDYKRIIDLFHHVNQSLPFEGNSIETFTSGDSFIQALLRELQQARQHIHIESYIFEDDAIGRMVRDVLIEKSRSGVEVRVIYDDVGCWHVPNRFFERMREAGIEVRSFLKVRFPHFTNKVNYRNHRKIIVIDGRAGFVGGMNLAERYVRGFSWGIWRDTHLMLKGKAVHGLQTAFLLDWYFVDRTLITNRCYYPEQDRSVGNDCIMQVVTSSPVGQWPEMMQGYVRILLEAKRYVYMETPYFLPTEPVMFAMRTAALAGIDVRLMVPLHSDAKFVEWASRSYVQEAVDSGVRVYLYTAGFNHSKLLVSDDSLSTCGSTNIDFRSFENNFESNVFIYDNAMALRIKAVFMEDMARCVKYEDYMRSRRLSFTHRLWESLVRMFSPLM